MIPPPEAFAEKVDAAARLLLVRLWTYVNKADPERFAWPSPATLASDLGCTDRSVRRSMATLRAAGLVWPGVRTSVWDSGRTVTRRGWYLVEPPADRQTDIDEWSTPDDPVRPLAVAPDEVGEDTGRGRPLHPLPEQQSNRDLDRGSQVLSLPGLDAPAKAEPYAELIDHVMRELTAACHDLRGNARGGPDPTCAKSRALIVKLVKSKPKVNGAEDLVVWSTVIRRQLASVRDNPSSWRYLALMTLTRPHNFIRLRDDDSLDATQRTGHVSKRPWSPGDWGED